MRFAFAIMLCSPAFASYTVLYLADSSAGANDGSSCANAMVDTFFNTSGNWGAGAGKIGAGTTVYLCSTITTKLTFQGSGTSGNPVILDGTNATISTSNQGTSTSSSYSIGCASQSWITIQNNTWIANYTNSIFMIRLSACTNAVIQGNSMDQFLGGGSDSDVIFFACASGTSSNVTIQNNTLGYASGSNNVQRDIVAAEGCADAIIVQGNQFDNRSPEDAQHDDMIQVFAGNGGANTHPGSWIVRYNRFTMNTTSTQNKSCHELENIAGTWDFYGNIYEGITGGSAANCLIMDGNDVTMVAHIYGNTFAQHSGGFNNILNLSGSGSFLVENNIIYNTNAGNALTGGGLSAGNRTTNLWYGANIPSCSGTNGDICSSDPKFTNFSGNDYTLLSSSPARTAGTNTSGSYNLYPIAGSTWPNPSVGTRPGGAPDIGAYQYLITVFPGATGSNGLTMSNGAILHD